MADLSDKYCTEYLKNMFHRPKLIFELLKDLDKLQAYRVF